MFPTVDVTDISHPEDRVETIVLSGLSINNDEPKKMLLIFPYLIYFQFSRNLTLNEEIEKILTHINKKLEIVMFSEKKQTC